MLVYSFNIEQHPMENGTDIREDKSVSQSSPYLPHRVDSQKLTSLRRALRPWG